MKLFMTLRSIHRRLNQRDDVQVGCLTLSDFRKYVILVAVVVIK